MVNARGSHLWSHVHKLCGDDAGDFGREEMTDTIETRKARALEALCPCKRSEITAYNICKKCGSDVLPEVGACEALVDAPNSLKEYVRTLPKGEGDLRNEICLRHHLAAGWKNARVSLEHVRLSDHTAAAARVHPQILQWGV